MLAGGFPDCLALPCCPCRAGAAPSCPTRPHQASWGCSELWQYPTAPLITCTPRPGCGDRPCCCQLHPEQGSPERPRGAGTGPWGGKRWLGGLGHGQAVSPPGSIVPSRCSVLATRSHLHRALAVQRDPGARSTPRRAGASRGVPLGMQLGARATGQGAGGLAAPPC